MKKIQFKVRRKGKRKKSNSKTKGEKSQIDWSKVSDFSEGIKEKIKRYEIADGLCVEVFNENKEPGKEQVDL